MEDKKLRTLVLQEHIIEQGFPPFLERALPGHLFFVAKAGEDTRGKWKATKNQLAAFAREVVPDERVAQNHGWRHAFQRREREVGIEDSSLDATRGWAPAMVGGRHGDVSLTAQAAAFAKFFRFEAETDRQRLG